MAAGRGRNFTRNRWRHRTGLLYQNVLAGDQMIQGGHLPQTKSGRGLKQSVADVEMSDTSLVE